MSEEHNQLSNFNQVIKNTQLTAIAAGFVSLMALAVSIYEAYLNREQQRISVLPLVDAWTSYNGESYGINIANKGTGPARVKSISLSRKDQLYQTWPQLYEPVMGQNAYVYSQSMLSGDIMAQGESISLLSYSRSEFAQQAHAVESEIDMQLCYCSIFDECHLLTLYGLNSARGSNTESIDNCPVYPENQF